MKLKNFKELIADMDGEVEVLLGVVDAYGDEVEIPHEPLTSIFYREKEGKVILARTQNETP